MKALQSLAFCLIFVSLTYAQDPEFSFKESYDVSLPAQLAISCSDGNIDVVSSEGNEIQIFYIVTRNNKVLKVDRKALEDELTVEVIHDANTVKITVKYPDGYWRGLSRDRMRVNFRIHAPEKTVSNLTTSDGNISLTGLTGDQHLKTSDGNIRIADVQGNVTGKTSDGEIDINEIRGSVDAGTSDGNIEIGHIVGNVSSSTSDGNIALSDVTGNTSAKTSDGHITFKELSGSFSGLTSDGNITGTFVQLKEKLTARTSDGNIDITIPGKLGVDLDIKGESLDVPLENFSGRSDEKAIQGKANGGGIPVNLSASDGRVSLASR